MPRARHSQFGTSKKSHGCSTNPIRRAGAVVTFNSELPKSGSGVFDSRFYWAARRRLLRGWECLGLGRSVIWTCHADDFDHLHFDTRQYNHIKWETPGSLRHQLADRIRERSSRDAWGVLNPNEHRRVGVSF